MPPYAFSWDTTKETEGSYQIVAQMVLSGQIVASAPVTIVVDRTAPTIVSSVPASGATNVSLSDPIDVVFSESLAPASVSASAVGLALGAVVVGTTASLGTDGKTITVAVANRSSLALPGAMTETVAPTITDLAGNAFAGASWSSSVPLWVDLGTVDGGYPQMVLDAAGEPVVVTASGTLLVSQHATATTWTGIPSPTSATSQSSNTFGITADKNGDLFVVWRDPSGLQLAQWTGAMWESLWTSPGDGALPAIAVNSDGRPFVSWNAAVAGGGEQADVASWTGTDWNPYPGLPFGVCDSVPCRIVLDTSDQPVVEQGSQLLRWSGSTWTTPVGSALAGLAIDGSNQVLSVQDTTTQLQVVALSAAGSLSNYVPVLNAAADNISSDDAPQLAIDDLGEPVIVWAGRSAGAAQINVARWTGATWDQNYGALTPAQGKAAVVLAQGSIPIVAWEDNTTASLTTHVAKSNH
ncbi:MAG TPA: Ig-like domain-containing protein [Polyangia bacterium]|nr:Ig-like domain-containing protein [Polyangia bacterium]